MRRINEIRRAKPSAQPDLLDRLLAARSRNGRGMSDAEVANNLLTFIAAGDETTAVALTWTLWLLAKDEGSQQRACDEVADVVGRSRPAMSTGLSNEPMVLGGVRIGARSRIHIPIFALHRKTQPLRGRPSRGAFALRLLAVRERSPGVHRRMLRDNRGRHGLGRLVRAFHFRPVAGVQTGGMPLLVTARANKPTALSRQQPARLRKA
jgi:hypothetical protein